MSILRLLALDGFLSVNKHLASVLGLDAAVLIAELASAHNFFESIDELTPEGMFIETVERIEANTTLSKYQQAKAVKVLEEAGILKTKKIGIPAKRYFYINEDAVLRILDHKKSKNLTTGGQKTEPQEGEKLDRNNKESNKSNNNRITSIAAEFGFSDPVREKVLEFINYRKQIKKPYKTDQGLRSMMKLVESKEQEYGSSAVIDVIDRSIQNEWQGLFFEKLDARKKPSKGQELDSFYQMVDNFAKN